ncbi:hypothetical protein [Burkholderia oklahomensis]|uniref:hypothetical protein n=1 Tax=Burkholderia oklahomensis TaxID=342113 RepID=UPI00016A8AB1|nr:hypothetical protein [Burkholderia oklahomensis]AJX30872.1 hypothetical protein BG90_183 [Burkholderia oklahomensis C6786]AOI46391.1 hypothetical protein WI23_11715 [Burkholderia oklahomensis C6786]KUY56210.1 hypothetical protein WI23_20015 [Burkholderia oklahomensis C6786]MBI0361003.1 hypothetical protein [Burkholderia oklahomensis]SUW60381.1 Uncharacterised protein [Burkholderia oklahomensis]
MTNETNEEKSRADAMTDDAAFAMYRAAAESITGRPTFEQWSAALVRAILAASPVEQHEAAPASATVRSVERTVPQVATFQEAIKNAYIKPEHEEIGREYFGLGFMAGARAVTDTPSIAQHAPSAQLEVTGNGADERTDALCDGAYCAGVHKGFQLGYDNDNEGLRKVLESRAGYVKVLRDTRAPRTEVAGAVPQPIGPHDVTTSAGGRGYIAEFFAKRLCRHDFGRYIDERLAADFACALAKYLMEHDTSPSVDAAAAPADERAAFEAWWMRDVPESYRGLACVTGSDGKYTAEKCEGAWEVWQAARAAASQPAAELTPREISALRELKKLGEHRYFAIRSAIAEAWPIVERLASRTPPAQSAAAAGQEAVAWVRKHPDTGELSGDWLWNDVIEQCRKDSGVWFPLGFLTAPPAQVATRQRLTDDSQCAARYRLIRAGFGDFGPDADLHNAFVDGGEKLDAALDALLEGAKQ